MKRIFFLILLGSSFIFQSCINDNEDIVEVSKIQGDIIDPNVGGPTQPNQVWIDLSENKQTITRRTDWDIALYSGPEFKVILNTSIMMGAGKIPNATNIDQVTEASVASLKNAVQVGNFNVNNGAYIDDVKGDFPTGYTAIEEIKPLDSDNAIYLLNMGKEIFTGDVANGAVATSGNPRGWLKIQIVRNGDGYKVKYAELNEATHKEIIVVKKPSYNYNFLSLKNDKEVNIQPEKKKWDICFTVFTNILEGAGSYTFADFVNNNNVGGAGVYEILVTSGSGIEAYNNFTALDIDASKLVHNDHRIIGANWRNPVGVNGLEVYNDRFYVIKDPDGHYFKLRFTRLTKTITGERGYPQFVYKPL